MQQPSPSEETNNLLARLSQRPGVQGTLVLSRDTGAIVRSSGLATNEDVEETEQSASTITPLTSGTDGEAKGKGTRRAEEVARLVWDFAQSASAMVEELNGATDEARLLRIRTRRNELVIVPGTQAHKGLQYWPYADNRPDAKFLLVVLHDTPAA